MKQHNDPWLIARDKYTSKEYVKVHAAIDLRWRAIISFHFTRTNVREITELETLLDPLWDLGNVYADSGYLSAKNCLLITSKGGTPHIHPRKNVTGKYKSGKIILYEHPYTKMFDRLRHDPETWMKQYHQRSVIEAVFSGLKRRLGGYVTSVKLGIQHVEIALKIIVYNLMMLVRKYVDEEYF